MRSARKFFAIWSGSLSIIFLQFTQAAYSQPVEEVLTSTDDNSEKNTKTDTSPKIEFYNWLYGSSRRNWFEWHTITAAVDSSLDESGIRLRGTGAIGGYVNDIKGNETENILASVNGIDDNFLPSMGTVGKFYGMNGFAGLQIGYTYASENWKFGAQIGASVVRAWSIASNMTTPIIKYSTDPSLFNGTRYGILASLEGEYHPTNDLVISVWGLYTPAYKWGYFEIKPGVALPFKGMLPKSVAENAYIGPHIALSISDGVQQPMLGAHLSGIMLEQVYLNVNAGYVHEQFTGGGMYSILETSVQF